MKTSDFYYDLPKELIAQDPLEDRSSSRLLHLSMKDGSIEHRHFTDILEYLNEAGYKSEWVVVERNFEIIPRENLGNVTIQDNDEIEVLRFVGGG